MAGEVVVAKEVVVVAEEVLVWAKETQCGTLRCNCSKVHYNLPINSHSNQELLPYAQQGLPGVPSTKLAQTFHLNHLHITQVPSKT